MKICVYAISKNEIKFVDTWFNSMKEADYVCVLDTGSTDGTFEKLKNLGVISQQKHFEHFRFDDARNESMKLIPKDADICVCTDLDEEFEKGWAEKLKTQWSTGTTRAKYRYTWNFNPDGSEGIVFLAEKIHKNGEYIWINPVHEILKRIESTNEKAVILQGVQLNHHADITKSRSNYLPLLELSIKEDPRNDRNMHYLGREYMFHGEYDKAIKTLKKHLIMPNSVWDEERCASLRYIANCYKQENKPKMQEKFLLKALCECDFTREPYFDLACFYFYKKKYELTTVFINQMLKITSRSLSYISSPNCWGYMPFDMLSLCYYYMKEYKKAVVAVEKAIAICDDPRLKYNRDIFINEFNNQMQKQS